MDDSFSQEKEDSRNQMRVNVDRLVVYVEPGCKTCLCRVGNWTVASEDTIIILMPFWNFFEGEKTGMMSLEI